MEKTEKEIPRLTIEDIRKKISLQDFKIKYSDAINLQDPSSFNYKWVYSVYGDPKLLSISVPCFNNVELKIITTEKGGKHGNIRKEN